MRRNFRLFILGLLTGVLALVICRPSFSQEEKPAGNKELTTVAVAVLNGFDKMEVEKALQSMTKKGEDEFIGSILMEAVAFSKIEFHSTGALEESGQPPSLTPLHEALEEFGIDKVELLEPDFLAIERLSHKEQIDYAVESIETTRSKLLATVKAEDRIKVAIRLSKILSRLFESPTKLQLGEIPQTTEKSERQLVPAYYVLDQAALEANSESEGTAMPMPGTMDEPQLAMQMIFVKSDSGWKFDGLDLKAIISQQNFQVPKIPLIEKLELSGQDVNHQSVNLADYKGKVVLVDFWGTWCGPCVASLPELKDIRERFHEKGFEVLGIAADEPETLESFFEKTPLPWKNITDAESGIAARYGIGAYPTTLLIDKNGKHVASNLHGTALEDAIQLLLDGKPLTAINGNAREILDAGLMQATAEQKVVFLHIGANWCGPCRALEKWLRQPEVKGILSKAMVDIKLDIDVNEGAAELFKEMSARNGKEAEGIPWYAVLNAQGEPLVTCSTDDIPNIGFPFEILDANPEGAAALEHFIQMLAISQKLSADEVTTLRKSVTEFSKQCLKKGSKSSEGEKK